MKFHLGDRIVMIKTFCGAKTGMSGTVVYAPGEMGSDKWEDRYGVDFDEELNDANSSPGHACRTRSRREGYARNLHGHWIPEECMDSEEESVSEIHVDEEVSFY